jgi:hypothetical protein
LSVALCSNCPANGKSQVKRTQILGRGVIRKTKPSGSS